MGLTGVRFKLEGKEFFDLYKSEAVNLVQKVSDFSKIDTAFGDFSFSFSIPATVKNLGLIDFYNDKSVVNSFNPFIEHNIEMYVNQELFSRGQFKLIQIVESNRTPKDIKIQYFAEITNLKFALQNADGDDSLLKDLSFWGTYNHSITRDEALGYLAGGDVLNNKGVTTPLKYPMASQNNIWHWQGANYNGVRRIHVGAPNYTGSDTDIGILNTEIRPAIPVSDIVAGIFELAALDNPLLGNYEVAFASQTYYTSLYAWLANGEDWNNNIYDNSSLYFTGNTNIVLTDTVSTEPFTIKNDDTLASWNTSSQVYTAQVDGTYDVAITLYNDDNVTISAGAVFFYQTIINGVTSAVLGPFPTDGTVQGTHVFTSGDQVINITFQRPNPFNYIYDFGAAFFNITSTAALSTDELTVSKFVPDMTCTEFLKGILRTFNAVMYWDFDQSKYIIDHKNDWYNKGKEINLSKAEDIKKSTMSPPTFYRRYDMNFEEATDSRSEQFKNANERPQWGFAKSSTGYKYGENYEVNNPFTATIWQQIVSVDAQGDPFDFVLPIPSFQTVDVEGKTVNPGCRLMYFNGIKSANGTYTTADATSVNTIGANTFNQFTAFESTHGFNIAYAPEYSWEIPNATQVAPLISESLYTKFYRDYISQIYRPETRRYSKTVFLTFQEASDIKLNDTVIIQGIKYYINGIKSNSLTGKVELDLIDKLNLPNIAI